MLSFDQYVTKTVEVESPATLKHLNKVRQKNELLSEKLVHQNERCKQLEEQIRKSDEYSCNLQHKVQFTFPALFVNSSNFEYNSQPFLTEKQSNKKTPIMLPYVQCIF